MHHLRFFHKIKNKERKEKKEKGIGLADLLDGGRPGESEAQEDNEEKGAPEIPIAESLAGVLSVGVGEYHELQIAHDPRQIPLHRVPHRLRQRVRSRTEPAHPDADGWHLLAG